MVPIDNVASLQHISSDALEVEGVSDLDELIEKAFEDMPKSHEGTDLGVKQLNVGRASSWTVELLNAGDILDLMDTSETLEHDLMIPTGQAVEEKAQALCRGHDGVSAGQEPRVLPLENFAYSPVHWDCAVYPGTGQVEVTGMVSDSLRSLCAIARWSYFLGLFVLVMMTGSALYGRYCQVCSLLYEGGGQEEHSPTLSRSWSERSYVRLPF